MGVRRVGGLGQVMLVLSLLLSLLPILLQGIQLQDYELVVGHGNGLIFWSQNHTHRVGVTEPGPKTRIVSILPHLETNSVYFTTLSKDTATVSRYDAGVNRSQLLFTGPKGSVGSLTFFRGKGQQQEEVLLWADPSNKSVWSLPLDAKVKGNTSTLTSGNVTEPKLFFQDPNATFDSIAVHPATGRLLFTVWRRANLSEILSYDPVTSVISPLVNNVFQPRGLVVAGDELYWIDNPPGIYFNLEKVSLSSGSENSEASRTLLLKGQNQHPFSLVVPCPSSLVWTELMHKVLMSWSPLTQNYTTLLSSLNGGPPHGLALLNPKCPLSTTTPTPTPIPWTTVPPANPVQKDEDSATTTTKGPKGTLPPTAPGSKVKGLSACEPWEEGRCLNGATCLKLDATIHCLCVTGFTGPRCRDHEEEEEQFPKGKANEGESPRGRGESWSDEEDTSAEEEYRVAVIILGCFVALLLLLVAGLVVKLQRLNKKPVIRRRVVVSHRSDLDSNNGGASVCEMIDIENCCNMNVCETPCYERLGSFSGGSSSTGSGGGGGGGSGSCGVVGGRTRKVSVKEDKKCLLTS